MQRECDVIVGIIQTPETLLCRMQATRVEDVQALIHASNMRIARDNLDQASSLAVKVSRIVSLAKSAHLGVNFELPTNLLGDTREGFHCSRERRAQANRVYRLFVG